MAKRPFKQDFGQVQKRPEYSNPAGLYSRDFLLTPIVLLFLPLLPNGFGWSILLLCAFSSGFQTFLFGSCGQSDDTSIFNMYCWKVQNIIASLGASPFRAFFFCFRYMSALVGLDPDTIWKVSLGLSTMYICIILVAQAYHNLQAVLSNGELSLEMLLMIIATTAWLTTVLCACFTSSGESSRRSRRGRQ